MLYTSKNNEIAQKTLAQFQQHQNLKPLPNTHTAKIQDAHNNYLNNNTQT